MHTGTEGPKLINPAWGKICRKNKYAKPVDQWVVVAAFTRVLPDVFNYTTNEHKEFPDLVSSFRTTIIITDSWKKEKVNVCNTSRYLKHGGGVNSVKMLWETSPSSEQQCGGKLSNDGDGDGDGADDYERGVDEEGDAPFDAGALD